MCQNFDKDRFEYIQNYMFDDHARKQSSSKLEATTY